MIAIIRTGCTSTATTRDQGYGGVVIRNTGWLLLPTVVPVVRTRTSTTPPALLGPAAARRPPGRCVRAYYYRQYHDQRAFLGR